MRVVVNQNLDAAGDASTHSNECCWLQLEIKQETLVHFAESDPLNDVLCMQPRGETLQQT